MSRRMRRPETVKLEISQGDWLIVKKHLTAGEQRQMFKGMLVYDGEKERYTSMDYGPSLIAAYLIDWSITDANDNPVVILDQPLNAVISALDALDTDSFREIREAIEKHQQNTEAELVKEKNTAGGSASSAISPSPNTSAGATNG